jgi:hypothetical protein
MDEIDFRSSATGSNSFIKFALADAVLWSTSVGGVAVRVHALSPSSAAVMRSMQEIAELVPIVQATRHRVPSLEPNDASVVLWVELSGTAVLLGADLEVIPDPADGWAAIVNSTTRPAGKASVYKVAHHGSKTGHHDGIFSDLLEVDTTSILTPWRRGKYALPTEEDQKRICAASGSAFTTVLRSGTARVRRDPVVEKTLREIGARVYTDPAMGHVQLRQRTGESNWRVCTASVGGSLCL